MQLWEDRQEQTLVYTFTHRIGNSAPGDVIIVSITYSRYNLVQAIGRISKKLQNFTDASIYNFDSRRYVQFEELSAYDNVSRAIDDIANA